jgi:TolA-binding protein
MAAKPTRKKASKSPVKAARKTVARTNGKSANVRQTKAKPKPSAAKAKPSRSVAANKSRRDQRPRRSEKSVRGTRPRVEQPGERVAPRTPLKAIPPPAPPPKIISKQFASAVHAYEAGIKLMYAEDYAKAIQKFNDLIAHYPDEPEIQASAKARIHACENKLHERARTVFRSADDHYNIGIALLNSGDHANAATHLQQALKLAPKADHILYALAAANALLGNKDQAVTYLKQSIHHRPENRFQAAQDDDFRALADEPAFKDLIAPPEK